MSQANQAVHEFLEALASRAATPGGGSASALVGAVGAALAAMVGRLNDKKSGEPGALHDSIATADELRARLMTLVDEDIAAFNAMAALWKQPDDPSYAGAKQMAVIQATRTPLEIMERARDVMHLAVEGLSKSKKNCISDAGVAGLAAHAALEGARLNVMINLPAINDPELRGELHEKANELREEGRRLRGDIERRIDEIFV